MKNVTVFIDATGRVVSGEVKRVLRFESSDGKQFANKNKCAEHEAEIAIAAIIGGDMIYGRELAPLRAKIVQTLIRNQETILPLLKKRNRIVAAEMSGKPAGKRGE